MALSLARTTGYRGYIEYDQIKQNNREMTTSFHWELEFVRKPIGVYLPPDRIMKLRIKGVTPPPDATPTIEEAQLHGITLKQHGLVNRAGEFTFNVQDFIDQSVEYAFRELNYESDRPLDHTAKPKSEMLFDCRLTQLNNQEVPIKRWEILDGLLSGTDHTNTMDSSKSLLGDNSYTISYQMAYVVQMNTTEQIQA